MQNMPPENTLEMAKFAFISARQSRSEMTAMRDDLKALLKTWNKIGPDGRHEVDIRTGMDFGAMLTQTIDLIGECYLPKGPQRLLAFRPAANVLLAWREAQGIPTTNSLYDRIEDGETPCDTIKWLVRTLGEATGETLTPRQVHSILRNRDAM